jgi:hypothetical protein
VLSHFSLSVAVICLLILVDHSLSLSLSFFCQIEYDDRAKASPLKEQPKQIANKKPVDDDDDDNVDGEDDLDIDAI